MMKKKLFTVFALAAIMLAGLSHSSEVPIITSFTGPSSIQAEEWGGWDVRAYDPMGQLVGITMDWGDGSQDGGGMSHIYLQPGTYTVTATASGTSGASLPVIKLVQVTPIPAPSCPGYKALRTGESIATGTYMLYLDGVDGQTLIAHYTLYYGLNMVAELNVSSGARVQYNNMPNTDVLGIDVCSNVVSPSVHSRVRFSIISGPNIQLATGSSIIPDDCATSADFTQLGMLIGDKVETPSSEITLSDISVATGSLNLHPAILDIKDKATTKTSQYIFVPHLVYGYGLPSGKVITIGICQTAPGFTLGSKWVKLRVTENGPQNKPPLITSVSGPTSLSANVMGTWNISAHDQDGTYLSYNVQWGDEASYKSSAISSAQIGSAATLQHTYSQAGNYTITFTVTDIEGASTLSTITVTVISPAGSCDSPLNVHFFYFPWCPHSAAQMPVNQELAAEFPCSVWHYHDLDENGEPDLLLALEAPLGVQGVQTPTTIIGQTILLGFDSLETPQKLRIALSSSEKSAAASALPPATIVQSGSSSALPAPAPSSLASASSHVPAATTPGGAAVESVSPVSAQPALQVMPDFAAIELAITAPTTAYNRQNVVVIQPNIQTEVGMVVRNAAPAQAPATEVRFTAFGTSSTSVLRSLAGGEMVSAKSYISCTAPGSLSILRAEVNPSGAVRESNYSNNAQTSLAILCANGSIVPVGLPQAQPQQDERLDRIIAILEQIRDFLFGIFGK